MNLDIQGSHERAVGKVVLWLWQTCMESRKRKEINLLAMATLRKWVVWVG